MTKRKRKLQLVVGQHSGIKYTLTENMCYVLNVFHRKLYLTQCSTHIRVAICRARPYSVLGCSSCCEGRQLGQRKRETYLCLVFRDSHKLHCCHVPNLYKILYCPNPLYLSKSNKWGVKVQSVYIYFTISLFSTQQPE